MNECAGPQDILDNALIPALSGTCPAKVDPMAMPAASSHYWRDRMARLHMAEK